MTTAPCHLVQHSIFHDKQIVSYTFAISYIHINIFAKQSEFLHESHRFSIIGKAPVFTDVGFQRRRS